MIPSVGLCCRVPHDKITAIFGKEYEGLKYFPHATRTTTPPVFLTVEELNSVLFGDGK